MRRIGLLGGTFDPPHIGHFIVAQEVKTAMNLDEIWFIPTNEPPHKNPAFFSAKDRLEMLVTATNHMHNYKVETLELNREGKSYTIDTIQDLKKEYPDDVFYFIIGADMVEHLPKWYQIDELLSMVDFVGVGRKDYSLDTTLPVKPVDIPLIEISSTEIKERLKNKQEIKYFVPHEIYLYMKEHYE